MMLPEGDEVKLKPVTSDTRLSSTIESMDLGGESLNMIISGKEIAILYPRLTTWRDDADSNFEEANTMRAFAMSDFENPPAIVDVPKPEAGPGEVLVRVHASSVNGFDLAVAGGMLKGMMDYEFPVILGKDFGGDVEAVGPGATRFSAGDRVFGVVMNPMWFNTCAWAEYVAVPEDRSIARLPDGVDFAIGGALGVAATAAFDAVEAVAPQAGETVLISGATGGVGAYAVQLTAARGATVIATAKTGAETDFVRGLGAADVVDRSGDLSVSVRAVCPDGVNAVIHLAGDGSQLADLLVPNGRISSTIGFGPDQIAGRPISATAIQGASSSATLERLAAEVDAGRLRVPIQRTYLLDETGQALADFHSGKLGKLAITID
jgi:NADPH:quinone reductase-like Zn-dependent oxidoreductase